MSDEQQQPPVISEEDAALYRIQNFLARVQDQYTAAVFARLVCHEYDGLLPEEAVRVRLWQESRNKVRAAIDVWQQEHGGQPATEFGVYSSVHLWLMRHFSAGHDIITPELCNRIHDRAAELDRRDENGEPEPEARPAAEEPQNDAD